MTISSNPKHEKVVESSAENEEMIQVPVSLLIRSLSYSEQLSSERTEREVKHLTSHVSLLADVMKCLEPITSKQTGEVQITVTTDRLGEPRLVKQRYVVNQKSYGR